MDRFEEIRASKLRHKLAVEFIMQLAQDYRDVGEDEDIEFYKRMQNLIHQQLQDAYTTGRMSNDTWK